MFVRITKTANIATFVLYLVISSISQSSSIGEDLLVPQADSNAFAQQWRADSTGQADTTFNELTPLRATPLVAQAAPLDLRDSDRVPHDNSPTPTVAPIPLAAPTARTTHGPAVRTAASNSDRVVEAMPMFAIRMVTPPNANVGEPALATIDVKNTGDVIARSVQLYVTLPEQSELTGAQPRPSDQTADVLRFDIGNLTAGATRSIQLAVNPCEAGAMQLAATVTMSAVATSMIQAQEPNLQIECQVPDVAQYGSTVTFQLTLRNQGDGVARSVTIVPKVLAPSEGVKTNSRPIEVGTLEAGQKREIHFKVPAISHDLLALQFEVTEANGTVAKAEGRLQVRRPVLEATIDGPQVSYLGRDGIFNVQVSNPGNLAASDVVVSTRFPAGMTLIASDREVELDKATNEVQWELESLQPSETAVLQLQIRPIEAGGLVSQMNVEAAGGLKAKAEHRTTVISRANLNVTVSSLDGPREIDSPTEFEVLLRNTGTKAAEGIRVRVDLPAALKPVEDIAYRTQGQQLTFEPQSVDADGEVRLQFQAIGRQVGDHVVRVTLESDSMSHTLSAETSTYVYDTQQEPRLSRTP